MSRVQYSSRELEGIEDGRNLLQYKFILYIGVAFIGAFTLLSFFKGRTELALFLSGCIGLVFLTHLYVIKTNNISMAAIFYALVMLVLVVYLFATGGVNGSGPLWTYPIIVLLIPLLGYLKGFIFSIVLIFMVAIVLMASSEFSFLYVYEDAYKLRYLGSLAALSLFSCAIEYSRGKAFSYMLFLSNELEFVSRTDPLTSLMNRRGIEDIFAKEVNRYARKGTEFSILMVDVDDFKQINDQFGHAMGDAILQELAGIMLKNLRNMDTVARWGGEEFLILLPETESDQAQVAAEKLRQCIEQASPLCDGLNHKTTVSIGVAMYKLGLEILSLADIADKALYKAKKRGKNQVVNADKLNLYADLPSKPVTK
jgi:diguanylate cyclase (GGDEF)-like protein